MGYREIMKQLIGGLRSRRFKQVNGLEMAGLWHAGTCKSRESRRLVPSCELLVRGPAAPREAAERDARIVGTAHHAGLEGGNPALVDRPAVPALSPGILGAERGLLLVRDSSR